MFFLQLSQKIVVIGSWINFQLATCCCCITQYIVVFIACVAGVERGSGWGKREKGRGKREGASLPPPLPHLFAPATQARYSPQCGRVLSLLLTCFWLKVLLMFSLNLTGSLFCRVRYRLHVSHWLTFNYSLRQKKGKIETLRNCVYMNKRIFSLFIAETINFYIIV